MDIYRLMCIHFFIARYDFTSKYLFTTENHRQTYDLQRERMDKAKHNERPTEVYVWVLRKEEASAQALDGI